MMAKMENIVFDRNYEEDEPDPLAQAIFDRVNAPGGFFLKPPGDVLRYMATGSAPLRKRRGCGIRRIRHTVMAGESDD